MNEYSLAKVQLLFLLASTMFIPNRLIPSLHPYPIQVALGYFPSIWQPFLLGYTLATPWLHLGYTLGKTWVRLGERIASPIKDIKVRRQKYSSVHLRLFI